MENRREKRWCSSSRASGDVALIIHKARDIDPLGVVVVATKRRVGVHSRGVLLSYLLRSLLQW